MALNPPTKLVFLISVIIAIIAVVAALQLLPFFPIAALWIMLISYLILAAGCIFKGV